jgi:hypothetical protein
MTHGFHRFVGIRLLAVRHPAYKPEHRQYAEDGRHDDEPFPKNAGEFTHDRSLSAGLSIGGSSSSSKGMRPASSKVRATVTIPDIGNDQDEDDHEDQKCP